MYSKVVCYIHVDVVVLFEEGVYDEAIYVL